MNQDRAKSASIIKDRNLKTITSNLKETLDNGGESSSEVRIAGIENRTLVASEEQKENKINFIHDETIPYDGTSLID
jgi:hypothetical protein